MTNWTNIFDFRIILIRIKGKHRGLGVHLSFVRSISMDKWKDTELEKMKVGGNRKAKEFFSQQGMIFDLIDEFDVNFVF